MGAPLVEARGVCKAYVGGPAAVPALRGVDLTVNRGEMVAIMGPSGCGKTTLLNCLAGLDEIDAGEIRVAGRSLRVLSDDERTRLRAQRMGFIFQSFNLLPVLTAEENVELPLLVSGVNAADARRRARDTLASVGLGARARHKPKELSGGEQQRVAIARSIVNDPWIVWADEPTGNLDTGTGLAVFGLLERLNRERGQTYVLVTHDVRMAERCSRIVRLESGRVVGSDPASIDDHGMDIIAGNQALAGSGMVAADGSAGAAARKPPALVGEP
jgi:putative ABC transport system ATP-binding protein